VLGFLPVATVLVAGQAVPWQRGFNPVLGFLPVATWISSVWLLPSNRFNPVLGFLPVATSRGEPNRRHCVRFQSRAGFSARRDERRRIGSGSLSVRFNPVLGFLPVATRSCWIENAISVRFQSRAGFSARRDTDYDANNDELTMFQSRAGFSARRDDLLGLWFEQRWMRFNPVLGFLPVAT